MGARGRGQGPDMRAGGRITQTLIRKCYNNLKNVLKVFRKIHDNQNLRHVHFKSLAKIGWPILKNPVSPALKISSIKIFSILYMLKHLTFKVSFFKKNCSKFTKKKPKQQRNPVDKWLNKRLTTFVMFCTTILTILIWQTYRVNICAIFAFLNTRINDCLTRIQEPVKHLRWIFLLRAAKCFCKKLNHGGLTGS